jgi:hypothetical protein
MFGRAWIPIAVALMLVACAEPPNKEMDQAQGAIAAARAAGAEQYAPQELAAAVTALKESREAVTQGDYRSALSFALDSRERAQNAAKQASDERAALGTQTERTLAQVRALLDRGDERLALAESVRVPQRTIMRAMNELANARIAVQEASAAADRGEYQTAQRALDGIRQRATATIQAIDKAIAARQPRSRR